MAILRSMYLKGATQKLGGVVLYQAQGRTLARELAPSVSNPRTPSQMEQRVKLANVVAVYRANRLWMAGAFEDKKQAESDYNAFVSANIANSRVATSKSEAAAGAAVVAPYKVTSGSLPTIEHSLASNLVVSNIYLGALTISSLTTIGQLSAAIIGNNNNIREGMQLSLIINLQQLNSETGIPYIVCRAYEMIINSQATGLITDYFPGAILTNTGDSNNALAFEFTNQGYGAATFIMSETTGGKTRVSTQSLTMFGANATYTQYTSELAWVTAVNSYGDGAENFLSSESAYTASQVITANSIASMVINGNVILPGATVQGPMESTYLVRATLSQPVPSGVTPTMTLRNLTAGVNIPLTNLQIIDDGLTLTMSIASDYSVESDSTLRASITIGDYTYTFSFVLTNGDIS